MLNIKDVFKIILVLQLLACTLATYGHPDAETIDFGFPTQPSRDQMIIEAAIKRGMDGDAVAELLRTKNPVVRKTTTPEGFNKTTTYKLEADGSISSKTSISRRNRYVYNSDVIPDELKHSLTGTFTRTFTDSSGSEVTQTLAVNQQKPKSAFDTDDLNDDWFNEPLPSWLDETPPSSPTMNTAHRTITRTFTGPNGERRTVQTWSSNPETFEPETAHSSTTSTRTYIKPNGEKHVDQTTAINADPSDFPNKAKFPPVDDFNWPSFEHSAFSPSWTPKSWEWPEFPSHPTTTTTTAKPKLYVEPEPSTRQPLPNLEDFLKFQYGQPANRKPTKSTDKTSTFTPKSVITTTPKMIKIEDLPVVQVFHNGKPASESILKALPPHLTPRTPVEPVLNVAEVIEVPPPNLETKTRTYFKTHTGPGKPTLKDLDPQMQDILKKAGIVPELEGDTITKTRKEPDGRTITTSYKVNIVPSTPVVSTHTLHPYRPAAALIPLSPPSTPIEEFLAKLGLTKYDIVSRNGHYSKTIIDENGDVLTATFVLSSPKSVKAEEKPRPKPLK